MHSPRLATFFGASAFSSLACPPPSSPRTCPAARSSVKALDRQIPALSVQGGLLDVTKAIETQTGVRVEASQAVYDDLPWGEDTSITVNVKNTTLRQTLDSITRHLGLTLTLGAEAVELEPTPALRRLGRRATLDEVQVLDLLASTPLELPTTDPTVSAVLEAVDRKLEAVKSPFAVEDRAFDPKTGGQTVRVARNATLMDAMEELSRRPTARGTRGAAASWSCGRSTPPACCSESGSPAGSATSSCSRC